MADLNTLTDAELVADPRLGAINHAWKEFGGTYDAVALRAGISSSVLDALYTLFLEDGITQKGICERASLSKQTVHSAVVKMEQGGLVRTERGKGRSVLLFLTPAGREKVRRVVRPIVEAEIRAYNTLSAQEFDQLMQLITRVGEELERGMAGICADNQNE
jgi:DNA-binding MarR family transcriptional regulator